MRYMIAPTVLLRLLKYTLYVFACMFGALWWSFLLPLFEPMGSGGFAIHLLSLWTAMSLILLLLTDTVASIFLPRWRFPGRLATVVGWHILALASVGFSLVYLVNA